MRPSAFGFVAAVVLVVDVLFDFDDPLSVTTTITTTTAATIAASNSAPPIRELGRAGS
jgi:hypothetical protein